MNYSFSQWQLEGGRERLLVRSDQAQHHWWQSTSRASARESDRKQQQPTVPSIRLEGHCNTSVFIFDNYETMFWLSYDNVFCSRWNEELTNRRSSIHRHDDDSVDFCNQLWQWDRVACCLYRSSIVEENGSWVTLLVGIDRDGFAHEVNVS